MTTDDHPADALRDWLSTYISTMHEEDLDILTLWTLHTHFMPVLYTTGRLLLDSPVPESGKTTVLDHMSHLALDPLQTSSVSSGALIPRLLNERLRTILIDEADRALNPDNPNNNEIISSVNSGYRRGGSRTVLVPAADGQWKGEEMSTFGAVAMAGNNPDLADDTRSRTIRVLLLPDKEGRVEDSEWEFIEAPAKDLHENIAQWAEANMDRIVNIRPEMPGGVRGRFKECWAPLVRVAALCSPEWQARAMHLAERALALRQAEINSGLISDPPRILMLRAMYDNWPEGQEQWKTDDIIPMLAAENPALWEEDLIKGRKRVTAQAVGYTLGKVFGLHTRQGTTRGDRTYSYHRTDFDPVFARMGIAPPEKLFTPCTVSSPFTETDSSGPENVNGVNDVNGVHGLSGGGGGEDGAPQVAASPIPEEDDPEPVKPTMVWGQRPEPPEPDLGIFEDIPEKPVKVGQPEQILDYLSKSGASRPKDVAAGTGLDSPTARTVLGRLKKRGEVHQDDDGLYVLSADADRKAS